MPRNAACQLSKFPNLRLGVLWSGRSGLVHHARRVVAGSIRCRMPATGSSCHGFGPTPPAACLKIHERSQHTPRFPTSPRRQLLKQDGETIKASGCASALAGRRRGSGAGVWRGCRPCGAASKTKPNFG
jgi:hypothetical protein